MSRIIFGISFLFILASVAIVALAILYPGMPNSNGSEPVIPTPTSILIEPTRRTTPVLPVATPVPVSSASLEERTIRSSPTPVEPLNSATNAQLAPPHEIEPTAPPQKINQDGVLEEGKKKEEQKEDQQALMPNPEVPNNASETLLVIGGRVFKPGRADLSKSAIDSIERLAPGINERPGLIVLVEGHSDSYSSESDSAMAEEENRKISIRRAEEVAKIIEQQGISPDRIVVRGYGDTRPVNSNTTQAGRSQNRRVEIKLTPMRGSQ